MNRRNFISAIVGTALAAKLLPEVVASEPIKAEAPPISQGFVSVKIERYKVGNGTHFPELPVVNNLSPS